MLYKDEILNSVVNQGEDEKETPEEEEEEEISE